MEKLVCQEIESKLTDAEIVQESRGKILFAFPGDPGELLFLRSVEHVYIFIRNLSGISRSRKSLGNIFKQVRALDLEQFSMLCKRAHRSKAKKNLTFRVSASMLGRHNFRRVDVQNAVENAIIARHGWKIRRENPVVEVSIDMDEDGASLGMKLTDEKTRKRNYKIVHLPGSLSPTVAYCMVMLSEPSASDIFVDPMCGVATIPIERSFSGKYGRIIAGDIEESVINTARTNIDAAGRSFDLAVWDVSEMPVADRSVDKIVCNLPFGKQTGSHSTNQILYTAFFAEAARILKPGGKAVVLSSERSLVDDCLQRYRYLKVRKRLRINLLGLAAYIYVIITRY